jgi:flagellin
MIGSVSNAPTLGGQRALAANQRALTETFAKLSTGKRINRGADDPAGLIAANQLSAALAELSAHVDGASRASNVAAVADGAIGEISGQLVRARGLLVASAGTGLTEAERQANQLELDSVIANIDRLGSTASFNGQPLLDGSMTLSVDGSSITLPAISSSSVGVVDVDGQTLRLSDLRSGGAANLVDGDLAAAEAVIAEATSGVATARGKIGSFQRAAQSHVNNDLAAIEQLAAARSAIEDTDYAAQAVELVRARIQVGASVKAINAINDSRGRLLDLLA